MKPGKLTRRNVVKLAAAGVIGGLCPNQAFAAPGVIKVPVAVEPVYIAPGGGEKAKIGQTDLTFKLDKSQTSGQFGSAEMTLPPGYLGAPPHYHKGFDEICVVLEGTLSILVGEQLFEVPPGGWHLRPRGIVHTFFNAGSVPAKFIEIYSPGGHEDYMKDLSKFFENGSSPAAGDMAALAARYDIVFAFDKLPGIMKKYGVKL